MEQLPAWAITGLLGLIGSAIGIISYFLKRRDSTIDTMATERKQVDVVLNLKMDKVLESLGSVNMRMTKIETDISHIQNTVNRDFGRIDGDLRDLKKTALENNREIADMRTKIAGLIEWKNQTERR